MDRSVYLAFGLSLVLAPLTLLFLRRRRILDHPTERSSHDRPTPRGGGFALAVSAVAAVAVSNSLSGTPAAGLIVATAGFGLVGLGEDVWGIRPTRRLVLQFLVAAAALPWLADDLTGALLWKVSFCTGVVVWLVAFSNSFNFMDGINGISLAQTFVAGSGFVIIGTARTFDTLTAGGLIAIAVALGFAPLNFPRARVFLGDVGSYFIGAWIAVLIVLGLRGGAPIEAMGGLVAVYLADTTTTLVRRIRMGERWMEPHRSHVYQRLTAMGWSHAFTTAFVAGAMLLCAALGTLSMVASTATRVAADAGLALVLVAYVTMPKHVIGWHDRQRGKAVAAT